MPWLNENGSEIHFKIYYAGSGVVGKTTSLTCLAKQFPGQVVMPLRSGYIREIAMDRWLSMTMKWPGETEGDKQIVLHLFTNPGAVFYPSARMLTLAGTDAILFVADSQSEMLQCNRNAMIQLEIDQNLNGFSLDFTPFVIQLNKRDLNTALPVARLRHLLFPFDAPMAESIASPRGIGCREALDCLVALLLAGLDENHRPVPCESAVNDNTGTWLHENLEAVLSSINHSFAASLEALWGEAFVEGRRSVDLALRSFQGKAIVKLLLTELKTHLENARDNQMESEYANSTLWALMRIGDRDCLPHLREIEQSAPSNHSVLMRRACEWIDHGPASGLRWLQQAPTLPGPLHTARGVNY